MIKKYISIFTLISAFLIQSSVFATQETTITPPKEVTPPHDGHITSDQANTWLDSSTPLPLTTDHANKLIADIKHLSSTQISELINDSSQLSSQQIANIMTNAHDTLNASQIADLLKESLANNSISFKQLVSTVYAEEQAKIAKLATSKELTQYIAAEKAFYLNVSTIDELSKHIAAESAKQAGFITKQEAAANLTHEGITSAAQAAAKESAKGKTLIAVAIGLAVGGIAAIVGAGAYFYSTVSSIHRATDALEEKIYTNQKTPVTPITQVYSL